MFKYVFLPLASIYIVVGLCLSLLLSVVLLPGITTAVTPSAPVSGASLTQGVRQTLPSLKLRIISVEAGCIPVLALTASLRATIL